MLLEPGPGPLSAAEALRPEVAARFRPLSAPRGLGLSAAPVWVRLRVENRADAARDCAVSWDAPLLERIELHLVGDDGAPALRARGGLALPAAERSLPFHGDHHGLALPVPAGGRLDLLLRAETRAATFVAVSARDAPLESERHHRVLFLFGAGAGTALLLSFMGLSQWAVWRDRSYLLYAGFLLAFAFYGAAVTGVGAFLLWPDHADLSIPAQPLFAGLSEFLGAWFIRVFLELRRRAPRSDQALQALGAGGLVSALLAFPSAPVATAVSALVTVSALTLGLREGVRAHRGRLRRARFYLVGFGLFSVCGVLWALVVLGVLPPAPALPWMLQLGAALTGAALLLALAERRLGESEERFRVAFETSPDCIAVTDARTGTYVAVNPGFTRVTGYRESELVGRSALELSIWADPADRRRMLDQVRASGSVLNLEFPFRFKDGTVGTGLMSARIIELGGQLCLLSITREISDLKRAERERARLQDELQQAQRLEAIGRLAAGIAHDFNNLLTVIRSNASVSLAEIGPSDPSREPFQEIRDAADRATALTRKLLAFGRRQRFDPRPVELSALVDRLQPILKRLVGEDMALAVRLAPDLPRVQADPAQVEQILINLAVNAREAVRYGGAVEIATGLEVVARDAPRGEVPPGRYCALSVKDSGPGIAPEVRGRVLEPFFTTKPEGTGLGLSVVHGIARQHGAHLEIESTQGEGTIVRLLFPALAQGGARPAGAGGAM
jgi:PAS domain S-box-containing protein